jgi:hypothetical protein
MKVKIFDFYFIFNIFSIHLVHHLLIFICAKMSDHHILAQPSVDLFRILVKKINLFQKKTHLNFF